jgi:hypothetical protein
VRQLANRFNMPDSTDTKQTENIIAEYALSQEECAILDAIRAEIQPLENDWQAHLRNVLRAHKLQGQWAFDAQANKFTRGKQ